MMQRAASASSASGTPTHDDPPHARGSRHDETRGGRTRPGGGGPPPPVQLPPDVLESMALYARESALATSIMQNYSGLALADLDVVRFESVIDVHNLVREEERRRAAMMMAGGLGLDM